MHATVQQLHRRISKQSKKSVSSKVKWWYDIPISTWQKQTGIASVCTRFSTVLDSTSKHCMLTQIMHHPQAKKLSRREMLKRALWRCSQSPPKASSKRGKKPSWNNKSCAELPGYNYMTVPNSSVTTFSFLHSIKDHFVLRKEKLTMHNLHMESKMTNVIFYNLKFFPYALENIFRLKHETSFLPYDYTFLSCNFSDVLTHL